MKVIFTMLMLKKYNENNKSYLDLVNNSNFNFKHLKVDDYKKSNQH